MLQNKSNMAFQLSANQCGENAKAAKTYANLSKRSAMKIYSVITK
jgi:hypothetical protein